MTPTPREPNPVRRPIRWWPAALILSGAALAFIYLWTLWDTSSTQNRVMASITTGLLTSFLLTAWLLFLSRLPGRTRLGIFAVLIAGLVALGALFRIEGVDGNLLPILRPRFGSGPNFAANADPATAGVTAPGPEDYPQFLGPGRDATLAGPRLARDWTSEPPRELWRQDVGAGWSSFAVVGDAAVTMELRGENEMVTRYALETGQMVWSHAYEAPYNSVIGGDGPRATPTIADGTVFALGATGVLSALDLGDGDLLWSRNVLVDTDSTSPEWGVSCSPLVLEERLIVTAGSELLAYRRGDGEILWRVEADRMSYSSPIFTTLAGMPQILALYQYSVAGHDPENGAVLWREGWEGPQPKVAVPLPIGDDRALFSAGYGYGSRLFQLGREVDSETSMEANELWSSPRLKSKFANMVVHDGFVYGLDDGILTCLDPATGERRWKRGRYGHGQLILVGSLLLIQTEKGDIVLVEPHPDEHRELTRFKVLEGKSWNPPVLSGRRLLVRNHRQMALFELPLATASVAASQ